MPQALQRGGIGLLHIISSPKTDVGHASSCCPAGEDLNGSESLVLTAPATGLPAPSATSAELNYRWLLPHISQMQRPAQRQVLHPRSHPRTCTYQTQSEFQRRQHQRSLHLFRPHGRNVLRILKSQRFNRSQLARRLTWQLRCSPWSRLKRSVKSLKERSAEQRHKPNFTGSRSLASGLSPRRSS